jgi:hypothetical protein
MPAIFGLLVIGFWRVRVAAMSDAFAVAPGGRVFGEGSWTAIVEADDAAIFGLPVLGFWRARIAAG